jgi:asparagine synthase (glutamine-hydrolysing)
MVKVDRATMAASLETRAPFLDARVVEAAWRLPRAYKLRDGMTKAILRDILFRHVPQALVERPKQGFAVPLDAWLRGALRDWAADLLAPTEIARHGIFRPEAVASLWSAHLAGRDNAGARLWTVLQLQAWLRARA